MALFRKDLPDEMIAKLVRTAIAHQHEEAYEKAFETVGPLRKAQKKQRAAAQGLALLLKGGAMGPDHGLEVARELLASRGEEPWALAAIGDSAEVLHDMRYLNGEPPDDPLFTEVCERLEAMLPEVEGSERELDVLEGLTTVARVLGRSRDELTERAHARIAEIAPERWQNHFNLGLFYKTRGRFAEGLAANQKALEMGGADTDSVVWNLGICATGAGDAETALATWKSIGQKIEMGRFDLPEGGYNPVKVLLAEFPLAERSAGDPQTPGREETIWVERLSPCHGIVRNALFQDIGVDYGDVVMFDGAAITYHAYGEGQVPVFPHLCTLSRQGYKIYEFAGTQNSEDAIGQLSDALSHDAIVYVHTEQFHKLCTECWENPELDHGEHTSDIHGVVAGKVCAPPAMSDEELRAELDQALEGASDIKMFVPELSRAAGDAARADVEARRMAMIVESAP